MQNIYKLPLMLEPQPEGGYTITCPLLPNLITEADTLEEVRPNVADALSALIEASEYIGQPLLAEDETAFLLRSPANRERLLKALENVAHGRNLVTISLDE